jgi:hypothetical protein
MMAMVVAGSPARTPGVDCSVARRAGAIVSGPFSVLLPPDGPSDLSSQLKLDAARLRRARAGELPLEQSDWLGQPLDRVGAQSVEIAAQLDPIRTRDMLVASYVREANHSPEVRLAYAVVWLALGHGGVAGLIGRRRSRRLVQPRKRPR